MIGMHRRPAVWAALAALALLGPGRAVSAQEGLYGPQVDEDMLLVRVLHASPSQGDLEVRVGEARFGPLGYGQVSAYRPVARDIYLIRAGGWEGALEPGSGTYFTVVVGADAVQVLEDTAHRDAARAQLYLYNLSPLPAVDLATSDGATRILSAVPPGGSAQAAVNPVPVALAVFSGGKRLAEVGDLGLRRGQSYSVFVLGPPGAPRVFSAQAAVEAE